MGGGGGSSPPSTSLFLKVVSVETSHLLRLRYCVRTQSERDNLNSTTLFLYLFASKSSSYSTFTVLRLLKMPSKFKCQISYQPKGKYSQSIKDIFTQIQYHPLFNYSCSVLHLTCLCFFLDICAWKKRNAVVPHRFHLPSSSQMKLPTVI